VTDELAKLASVLVAWRTDELEWSAIVLSARLRKLRPLRLRSAKFQFAALCVLLALAVARLALGASPAWADDATDNNNNNGANGAVVAGSSNGGPPHSATVLPQFSIGSSGRRWFSNSAAKLTAPLRMLLRRTQRASAHAATGIVHSGETTLDWLTNRVRALPDDQDKALAAVKDGEIVPLSSVLKTVEKSVPGDVLNVALTKDTVGSWNYTITVLTPQGFYRDVNVDAGKNNVTSIRPH
jgi:uncharacterized membrane protein YkoI